MFGLTPKQFPESIPRLFTTGMEPARAASLDTARLAPPALFGTVLARQFPFPTSVTYSH